jgi:hypothetical protein
MKKTVGLFLLISVFFIVTPSFAFTDICKMGEKALTMTSAQMDEFFEDEIKTWRLEGSGKVYDVRIRKGLNTCIIIVNCGNDVFIHVNAGDYWGSKKDLKIGQKISFTGSGYKLKRKYYRDSDKFHILVYVDNAYLKY